MNIFNFLKKNESQASSNEMKNEKCTNETSTNETNIDKTEPEENHVEENSSEKKCRVFNLIILDESGSMISIHNAALKGLKQTLDTIRGAQLEHAEQEHFVSLVSFSTLRYNEIYNLTPASKILNIDSIDYRPNGGTPLFDAIGRSVMKLSETVTEDDVVLVTIITDGEENSSEIFSGKQIKQLIENLREQGWVFTYIGANQDVDEVAESLSIKNRMAFKADEEGMKEMWDIENSRRGVLYSRVSACVDKRKLDEDFFEK